MTTRAHARTTRTPAQDLKELFAANVLPKRRLHEHPLPGWPSLLTSGVGLSLIMALWRAFFLSVLVWLAHRYWWPVIPALNYLAAVGICFLAEFLRPGSRPAPQQQ